MNLRYLLLVPAALCVLAACGDRELSSAPDDPPAPPAFESPDLVGTWRFEKLYPSGDRLAMVRTFAADGSGSQYAERLGPESRREFDWELDDGGTRLCISENGMLLRRFDIVRCAGCELVLRNAWGLEEVCRKR